MPTVGGGASMPVGHKAEILHDSSARFVITSEGLTLDRISAIVGREPDNGWSIGDRAGTRTGVSDIKRTFAYWSLRTGLPAGSSVGHHLDTLLASVSALSPRIRGHENLAPALSIVQHFSSESDLGCV
jgi:hypothetical protein